MKRFILVFLLILSQHAFGYDFKDLCKEIAPSTDASKAILAVLQSLEAIQFDTETEGFIDFLRNGMDTDSFYLGDIYRSEFFKPAEDGYRALTLMHVRKSGTNKIIVSNDSYNKIDVNTCKDYLGVQELGIRENPFATLKKYRSFSVYFKSKESWEKAGDINPANIADGMLKIMDPINIKQMQQPQTCVVEFENLKDETKVLVDNFSNTFPTVAGIINRYVELNNFVLIEEQKSGLLDKVITSDQPKDVKYTHGVFKPEIKMKDLKKDFPDLADYIKKYRKLFKVNGMLKNKNGHIYATLKLTPKEIMVEGYTYQGKIIPFDEDGKLIFSEAGTFETEKEIVASGNMQVDFLGLDIKVEGDGLINHEGDEHRDFVKAKLQNVRYEYSGRLLGFIPMSVIKLLSPIDIDKFADDMLYTMLNANNGEGTIGTVEWVKDDNRNRFSYINVSSEMLDHYTIQFFMRYSRIFIGSSDAAIEEARTFGEKVLSAVIVDAKDVYSKIEYNDGVGLASKD